jgi:nucleotide-binding universal stress UspA family protein
MVVFKILVPLDGSANSFRGLDRAIYLARQYHGTITGLYVVPMDTPHSNDPISSMEKLFLNNAANFMRRAKIKAAKSGVVFNDKIMYGEGGVEIVRYAKKDNCDIIVIGSRGQSEIKEYFLGSTSNYVLHKSPMPVMIVK